MAPTTEVELEVTFLDGLVAVFVADAETIALENSRGKRPIQKHLYDHKLGTQYPVTKVTSDDVTMMTS